MPNLTLFERLEICIQELQEKEIQYLLVYEDNSNTLRVLRGLGYFEALQMAADLIVKYNLDTDDLLYAIKEEIKYSSKEREKVLKKELNNLKKLN